MKVLITGGAGYIGSTVASACEEVGIVPVVLDDLSTGSRLNVRDRIFYDADIADAAAVDGALAEHPDIHALVHCAARIVVPESVADPLGYYRTNVASSIALLDAVASRGLRRVIFSSSAAVYADVDGVDGVAETAPLDPLSPYARSKAMVESILRDASAAGVVRSLSLRYFNPIGVDPKRRTGPTVRPSHVLGMIMGAADRGEPFTITGTDWPTRDGSGLRDFIHVWDLARAHVQAVIRFDDVATDAAPARVLNIGTGVGTTVRELVEIVRPQLNAPLEVRTGPRRPGDTAGAFARVGPAHEALDWRAELSVAQGVADALAWNRRGDYDAG